MNYIRCLLVVFVFGCTNHSSVNKVETDHETYITILGVAQDGGYPHINNPNEFSSIEKDSENKKYVVSLGLIDKNEKKKFLFEATPDMPFQLNLLESNYLKTDKIVDGVFLTHAHMGHYTGLMHFGREAMGVKNIPVYAMPKMRSFLEQNGPWSQLVALNNVSLKQLRKDSAVNVTKQLKVTPFLVPHRDEFSETVGYKIEGPSKTALFIPDIDKWSKWEKDVVAEVKRVDYALIDASFFEDGEIPRPMSEVPHPFIKETAALFKNESPEVKSKVIFIHFNHSNPALDPNSEERKELEKIGFKFAVRGMNLPL
ncbi:MBL fold metallo-hydrolase [Spongiivirga citrea]|uniref:Pyrroloquinoline quinone biosynthesis protein PqqB n=1 Tax=Spongiivirga citrea TaxID=1481457 RepID=A0A6M0CIE5_9FLAO|nr:MBL fold metallo-hydrolase [Spongiivirga citrea]NER17736.1 pyrroloquinoline quinone biosynthesis protein PqqB [Spongiivirga citrea]